MDVISESGDSCIDSMSLLTLAGIVCCIVWQLFSDFDLFSVLTWMLGSKANPRTPSLFLFVLFLFGSIRVFLISFGRRVFRTLFIEKVANFSRKFLVRSSP